MESPLESFKKTLARSAADVFGLGPGVVDLLELGDAVRNVLKRGLAILGVAIPDAM